jgi:drug/metabolite transporter (DMT)-like permease
MPASARHDNLKLAIGAILFGCLGLSLGDALIKQSSASFVLWQIFFVRSAILLPFLIYIVRLQDCRTPLRPLRLGWTLLRSLVLVSSWIFYFAALPHIGLANAAAALYTLPIFIALFAALFLGESIRGRGWLAVVLGFAGTLLILQPEAGDFEAYALLPIGAAICYAAAMILTRSHCRGESPTLLSLWLNLAFIAVGALGIGVLSLWSPAAETVALNPFLLGPWTPLELEGWRTMAILAAAILVGSVGAAVAYQQGPASIVAIFDFSYLPFAILWGHLLFDDLPSPTVAGGMLLIVVAGTLAVRQRRG